MVVLVMVVTVWRRIQPDVFGIPGSYHSEMGKCMRSKIESNPPTGLEKAVNG